MHLWRRLGRVQVNLASALALHKRSFYLPTNFTNFRASEHRAEFIRNLPSAAENIELVKIRATYKVAFIKRFVIRVYFLTFSAALGIVQINLPSALACTKIREIRGQIINRRQKQSRAKVIIGDKSRFR